MSHKKKIAITLILLTLILISGKSIIFFLDYYRILKLANFTVEFPDNQNLSGKLYAYSSTEYVLVVTEEVTHQTEGFFLGFYGGDNFVGIAFFNPSKYLPFMNYAITGMGPCFEPTSFMVRFDADVDVAKDRIDIFVKSVHSEAKDWLPEKEARNYLIYQKKLILTKQLIK